VWPAFWPTVLIHFTYDLGMFAGFTSFAVYNGTWAWYIFIAPCIFTAAVLVLALFYWQRVQSATAAAHSHAASPATLEMDDLSEDVTSEA